MSRLFRAATSETLLSVHISCVLFLLNYKGHPVHAPSIFNFTSATLSKLHLKKTGAFANEWNAEVNCAPIPEATFSYFFTLRSSSLGVFPRVAAKVLVYTEPFERTR